MLEAGDVLEDLLDLAALRHHLGQRAQDQAGRPPDVGSLRSRIARLEEETRWPS